ncbi:MAG TPA: hypothetical protein VHI50_15325 [Micromonosporaceae bacterium]|jgi:hypothetical protein|nr:hypothetical protein [Micromonosporaceae bacterium]
MRGKMWFIGGLAAGFVLGARAGKEKYEELVRNARKVWDHPTVQEAAGVAQAQANRLYTESKEAVSDKLSNTRLGERLSGGHAELPADESKVRSTAGTNSAAASGTSSGSRATGKPANTSSTF